jgi:hypothetical protein
MRPETTTKELNAEMREAVTKWLWVPGVPKVFVTLRTRDSAVIRGVRFSLTAAELSRAVYVLMERLSRRYFPVRDVARGEKLRHAFACEAGDLVGLHYHGWIEVPDAVSTDDFCHIVDATWRSIRFGDYADVQAVWSDGALSYSLKEKPTGHFFDHIDLKNISL